MAGTKPQRNTPADRRLKSNKDLPPRDVSTRSWSQISEADYADADEYCAACLIDLNPDGKDKTKALCKLPVREPKKDGGKVNINAVHSAEGVLMGAMGGVNAPPDARKAAAKKLVRLYANTIDQKPPASLKQLASS